MIIEVVVVEEQVEVGAIKVWKKLKKTTTNYSALND